MQQKGKKDVSVQPFIHKLRQLVPSPSPPSLSDSQIEQKYASLNEYLVVTSSEPVEAAPNAPVKGFMGKVRGFLDIFARKEDRKSAATSSDEEANAASGNGQNTASKKAKDVSIQDFQIIKPISRGSFGYSSRSH